MSGGSLRGTPGRGRIAVLLSFAAVLALWQAAASTVPSYVFPAPVEFVPAVAAVAAGEGGFSPVVNYGFTLARVGVAAAVSVVVGVAGGIFLGVNDRAREYLYAYVLMTFAFPSVIWALLAVLWFGLTTFLVPVFTVFMIVAPYVVIITYEGMEDLDPGLVEMGDAFGAGRRLRWRHIYVPHLYPHIFAGIRLSITLAWKITIVAEIFGTERGVGQAINFFFQSQRADMILAWALPMMALMYGIETVLSRVEDRTFSWRADLDAVVVG